MRKNVLLCAMLVLMLTVLFVASVSAAPKWFRVEGANLYPWASVYEHQRFVPWFEEHPPHRATDPLLVVESLDETLWGQDPPEGGWSVDYEVGGWVTFECESQEGFVYSIDVKGLYPKGTYDVLAFDVLADFAIVDLGDITTDDDGDGEIEGVMDVDPGFHVFAISVNLDGTPILETLPPFTFYDPDFPFIWIDELGMSFAEMLWTLGDSADFMVFP